MGAASADEFAKQMGRGPGSLANYPPVSRSPASGGLLLLFGLASVSAGVVCVLIWLGVIVGSAQAPLWVIGVVGGAFGLAGLAMLWQGAGELGAIVRQRRAPTRHPNEPWRADHDWSGVSTDGTPGVGVRSRDAGVWWSRALGLAVVVCLGVVAHWVALPASMGGGGGGPFVLAMALVCDLFGVIVIGVTAHAVVARLRFGSPRLVVANAPARPGGRLEGFVRIPRGAARCDEATLTLRFVVERYTGRGPTNRRQKSVIDCRECYAETRAIRPKTTGRGVEIPVSFAIPEIAPENRLRDRPASFWDLEVRAEMPGVDLVHRFTVPVYRGHEAD